MLIYKLPIERAMVALITDRLSQTKDGATEHSKKYRDEQTPPGILGHSLSDILAQSPSLYD